MQIILTALLVLLLLLINEWWWRGRTHGEASRKFIHITVGSFVAFWPLFLTWQQIIFMSIAFVVTVMTSKRLQLFRTIHTVQRPTYGELFFGIAVGSVALITHQPAIYAAALLHMSLADGLAAIIGSRYGQKNSYEIFGLKKSRYGTLTFLLVSLAILSWFSLTQQTNLGLWMAVIAGGATILENIAGKGFDNLLVPIFVAGLLVLAT